MAEESLARKLGFALLTAALTTGGVLVGTAVDDSFKRQAAAKEQTLKWCEKQSEIIKDLSALEYSVAEKNEALWQEVAFEESTTFGYRLANARNPAAQEELKAASAKFDGQQKFRDMIAVSSSVNGILAIGHVYFDGEVLPGMANTKNALNFVVSNYRHISDNNDVIKAEQNLPSNYDFSDHEPLFQLRNKIYDIVKVDVYLPIDQTIAAMIAQNRRCEQQGWTL